MICQLSARSSNSVADLVTLDHAAVITLADEVRQREEATAWSTMHEQLARIHDLLQIMRVEQLACAGVKDHKLPDMVRMPRPGEDTRPKSVSPAQAARLMMVA